ncbi:hypothetical protein BDY19DRAFT_998872 [Irpex rosettiformis]|uniref:Uncharacterized protein n=1 Tax=Irpex rosettiformis TaxID=378272 RepID=A0ACB8TMC2_9APHY|nr:hypothetical protein BDY19DRAFT_998872 [Irpex rosettiformis]
MTMWERMAPENLRRIILAYAELTNTPRIGTYDNYMWSSCQLNLAEPQRTNEEQSLGLTNGRFGDCHVDSGDSPTHLSCATVLSDIPSEEGWEPGRMHFVGVGCYTVLSPFKQFFFTGLQLHGSTRPLVPDSFKIPQWACRAMLISYPSKAFALGMVRHCFGVMPGKRIKTFYMPPDVYGGIHKNPLDSYHTAHTSTAQDGTTVMDDAGLVNFHGRGLLSWAHWIMELLPPRLQIEIDPDKFLSAFTYRDGTNGRVGLRPWSLAPSPSVNEPFEDRHVDTQIELLHTLYDRMAKGIPDLPPNPFENEYLTDRGRKTRPEAFNPPAKKMKVLAPYDEFKSAPLPTRSSRKSKRQSNKRRSHKKTVEDSEDSEEGNTSLPRRKRRKVDTSDEEDDLYSGYNLWSSAAVDFENSTSSSSRRIPPVPSSSRDNGAGLPNEGCDEDILPVSGRSPEGKPVLALCKETGESEGSSFEAESDDEKSLTSISDTSSALSGLSNKKPRISRHVESNEETMPNAFEVVGEGIQDSSGNKPISEFSLFAKSQGKDSNRRNLEEDASSLINSEPSKEEKKRIQRIRDFCLSIGEDSVKLILSSVVVATRHIHEMRSETLALSTSSLDEYQLISQPFRMDPSDLSKYMSVFSMAKKQRVCNEVWSLVLRQKIILHEHRLASAVLDIENTLCSEIFAKGTFFKEPSNWLERLLRDIHIRLVLKNPMNLSSHLYFQDVGSPRIYYSELDWAIQERSWTSNRPSEAEFLRRTAIYLGRILRSWFDLPENYLTRGRAQLVDVLVAKFGSGILYLPQFWYLHRDLPRFIYRNPPHDYHSNLLKKERPYDPSSMDDFVEAVNSIPNEVVAMTVKLAGFYQSYQRLVEAFKRQEDSERDPNSRKYF